MIQCYRWTGKIGERTGVFPFNYVEAVGGGVSEEVSKEAEVNCPFFDCHLAQVFSFHQASAVPTNFCAFCLDTVVFLLTSHFFTVCFVESMVNPLSNIYSIGSCSMFLSCVHKGWIERLSVNGALFNSLHTSY